MCIQHSSLALTLITAIAFTSSSLLILAGWRMKKRKTSFELEVPPSPPL